MVFNGKILPFDFLGYKEGSCRKYRVLLSKVNNEIENSPQLKNELFMFRCPPMKTEYIGYFPKSIHLYYVASNLSNFSITLFARDNDKKESPKQELNINGLSMQPILEHISRERFLPAPLLKINTENIGSQKNYQEIEDEINSSSGEVRTPLTLKRIIEPNLRIQKSEAEDVLQSTRDRWQGDHVLISFSKVKTTKLSK